MAEKIFSPNYVAKLGSYKIATYQSDGSIAANGVNHWFQTDFTDILSCTAIMPRANDCQETNVNFNNQNLTGATPAKGAVAIRVLEPSTYWITIIGR